MIFPPWISEAKQTKVKLQTLSPERFAQCFHHFTAVGEKFMGTLFIWNMTSEVLWKAKGTTNNAISCSEFCDKAQGITLLLVALVWVFPWLEISGDLSGDLLFFPGWVEPHLTTATERCPKRNCSLVPRWGDAAVWHLPEFQPPLPPPVLCAQGSRVRGGSWIKTRIPGINHGHSRGHNKEGTVWSSSPPQLFLKASQSLRRHSDSHSSTNPRYCTAAAQLGAGNFAFCIFVAFCKCYK